MNWIALPICISVALTSIADRQVSANYVRITVFSNGDVTINGGPVLSPTRFKQKVDHLAREGGCIAITVNAAPGTDLSNITSVTSVLHELRKIAPCDPQPNSNSSSATP